MLLEKNRKILVLASSLFTIIFFITTPVSAISSSKFHVAFVDEVYGYGKYLQRTPEYEKGDTVKIYAAIENINRGRAYAVDFVAVITDPNDYVVAGKVQTKRHVGYEDRTFVTFNFGIPEEWAYGKYKVDIYVFDVLNYTATYEEYRSLYDEILYSGKFDVKIHSVPREDADYVKKTVYFYVKKEVVKPASILVFDSHLKATILPKGMNNTLLFTVLNTLKTPQKFYVKLYIDEEKFSEKKIELQPESAQQVGFEIPQLEVGNHSIEIAVETKGVVYSELLPIFIPPLLFDSPIEVGRYGEGYIAYLPNNYVLGSVGISELKDFNPETAVKVFEKAQYDYNRDNAAKILTNVLAYLWRQSGGNGTIEIALLKGSDDRAEVVLPELLSYITDISGAPVKYLGVREYDELEDVDVLFYVTSSPELEELKGYISNGGIVILDTTSYWSKLSDAWRKEFNLSVKDGLLHSFFDLSINKTVSIRLKTELRLPPELKYSDLEVSDFIVEVGTPVVITFKVKNEGGAGKQNVTVFINDQPVYDVEMEFFPGDEKNVTFEYIPTEEGSYKVVLDKSDIGRVFFAKAKKVENITATPTPEVKERRGGELIAVLAALLAVLIALRIYLRQ
jgi:hypothetical protein